MLMIKKILNAVRDLRGAADRQVLPCRDFLDHPAISAMDLRELADLPPVERGQPASRCCA